MSNWDRKSSRFTSVREVVFDYMNETGGYEMSNFMRYSQIVIRYITQLNLHVLDNIEIAHLPVNTDLNSVDLPQDYISYTKVAINVNERLWTLTENRNINLPRENLECGEETRDTVAADSNLTRRVYFVPSYSQGNYTPTLYGRRGARNIGYFRIDKKFNSMYLEGDLTAYGNEIILEYVSSGIGGADTVVPRQAHEVLISWLKWKVRDSDPLMNATQVRDAENQLGIEEDKLKDFEWQFTLDDYMDEWRSTLSQSIKR